MNDIPAANPSNPSIQFIAFITPVIQSIVKIKLIESGSINILFSKKLEKKGNNWKLSILKPLPQRMPESINSNNILEKGDNWKISSNKPRTKIKNDIDEIIIICLSIIKEDQKEFFRIINTNKDIKWPSTIDIPPTLVIFRQFLLRTLGLSNIFNFWPKYNERGIVLVVIRKDNNVIRNEIE